MLPASALWVLRESEKGSNPDRKSRKNLSQLTPKFSTACHRVLALPLEWPEGGDDRDITPFNNTQTVVRHEYIKLNI